MQANLISLIRIVFVFFALWFFTLDFEFKLTATILTILIIYMDSLDGYIARKLKQTSNFGALLDIAGDRIVENAYWIFFACYGIVTFWIPIIVTTRGFLTDLIRAVAYADGKTPFGKKTHLKSKVARFICASPFSRTLYSIAKIVTFVWIGLYITIKSGVSNNILTIPENYLNLFSNIGVILAYITVTICVIRGLPIIWESRHLLLAKSYRWKESS